MRGGRRAPPRCISWCIVHPSEYISHASFGWHRCMLWYPQALPHSCADHAVRHTHLTGRPTAYHAGSQAAGSGFRSLISYDADCRVHDPLELSRMARPPFDVAGRLGPLFGRSPGSMPGRGALCAGAAVWDRTTAVFSSWATARVIVGAKISRGPSSSTVLS